MKWIWQQPDWPDFRYDNRALNDRELEFRLNSERLAGSFDALPMASQEDATIDLSITCGELLTRMAKWWMCIFRPVEMVRLPNAPSSGCCEAMVMNLERSLPINYEAMESLIGN